MDNQKNHNGMKILIVDDNAEDRSILHYYLKQLGGEILEAADGAEGLEIARSERPDLIISDALMPNIDGFELLREINRSDVLRNIPFIFYSAVYTGCRDEELAMSLGADAFLIKPLEPKEFLHQLENVMAGLGKSKKRPVYELLDEDERYLREYSRMVASRLEEKVRELEKVNRAIVSSETRYRNLFSSLRDVVVIADLSRTIIDVNQPATRELFGYETDELLGQSTEIYYAGKAEFELAGNEVFNRPEDWAGKLLEMKFRRKSGELFDGELFALKLLDYYGKPVGNIGIIRDITERKLAVEDKLALEQQLHQAQKLESLGVLAGGIAHDFNNILCVIVNTCSLAQLRPHMAGELLPEIDKAAQRAAELCRQMLAYAGKSLLAFTKVKMVALVDDMIKMLKATIKQNVTITSDLSANIPSIGGDASQLRQIVMNLIINASEAIGEEQGDVRVSLAETTVVEGRSDKDHIGKSIPAGHYVCLEVTDNGCGMNDDTRQRVFEPFYTTKFSGRGLGMSAVLGIITAHKGALQLTSKQGAGTTFKVYLPVLNGESAGDSLPHVSLVPWQGSGTILLVEDEPQLMIVAKMLMTELGFSVLEAANGKEALELYHKNAEYIDLVVTDIGMPAMDGYVLLKELKNINPELPIIISSGFGDIDVKPRIADGGIAGFLSKPYSLDQLRKVLKCVLEGGQKPVQG